MAMREGMIMVDIWYMRDQGEGLSRPGEAMAPGTSLKRRYARAVSLTFESFAHERFNECVGSTGAECALNAREKEPVAPAFESATEIPWSAASLAGPPA